MTEIQKRLFSLANESYRDFNAKLIPGIGREKFIGVKTPELKSLARELVKGGQADDFLKSLPHTYFEENQLHAFIISEIEDFDCALKAVEKFLPYIDNWATCDQTIIKVFAKNPERLLPKINKWLEGTHEYTVRFAIGLLMRYFLDERFELKYPKAVAEIKREEYYINMMAAWYFASALAKRYDEIYPFFKENRLPIWVHNKAIQKARESYRVTNEHKKELKMLVRR